MAALVGELSADEQRRLLGDTARRTYRLTATGDDTVLTGIHPLLTGELLAHLDAMGHSDAVVLADAHFPAHRLATRLLPFPVSTPPGCSRPSAPCSRSTTRRPLDLMGPADGDALPVQDELVAAAGAAAGGGARSWTGTVLRRAAAAYLIVRTGETRAYGNAILRKGVVTREAERVPAGGARGEQGLPRRPGARRRAPRPAPRRGARPGRRERRRQVHADEAPRPASTRRTRASSSSTGEPRVDVRSRGTPRSWASASSTRSST